MIILHSMASGWETILITVGTVKRQQNYVRKLRIFRLMSTDMEISPYMCLFEVMGAQNISRFQTSKAAGKGTSDTCRYCSPYAWSLIRESFKIMYVATSYASLPYKSHCESSFVINLILFNITQS